MTHNRRAMFLGIGSFALSVAGATALPARRSAQQDRFDIAHCP